MEAKEIKQNVELLSNGKMFVIPESDYGKAEIWRVNDLYVVFEIPWLGGKPMFFKTYRVSQIEEMILEILSLT